MSEATTTRAAMIVIGNEILSGKITDSNSGFLARELRRMGVSLERIVGSGISWTFAATICVAWAFRMIAPSIFATW